MSSDWRLRDQERYFAGAQWVFKRYRAPSETWEYDHCEFCWAKFMDPDFSPEHQRFIGQHPEVLTEGYATTAEHPRAPTTTGSALPASTTSPSASAGVSWAKAPEVRKPDPPPLASQHGAAVD